MDKLPYRKSLGDFQQDTESLLFKGCCFNVYGLYPIYRTSSTVTALDYTV